MNKFKVGFVVTLIIAFCVLSWKAYQRILPTMEAYGHLQIRQFTSAVVTHAKKEVFYDGLDEKLVTVARDDKSEIESIDYDLLYINELVDEVITMTEATIEEVQLGHYQPKNDSRYERYLESISEKEGVLAGIPLESLITFPPVSFLRLKIPVRFQVVSNVVGKVNLETKSYGINNTLVKINVQVTVQQKMVLPFFTDVKEVAIEFPVAMKMIRGKIPNTYLGGQDE